MQKRFLVYHKDFKTGVNYRIYTEKEAWHSRAICGARIGEIIASSKPAAVEILKKKLVRAIVQ